MRKKTMKTPTGSKRRTITTALSRKYLRTYEFFAWHHALPVQQIMQSQLYGEVCTLTDDIFRSLEWWDSQMLNEDLEVVTLEFCPEVFALLKRIAVLLRRPLAELAQSLLSLSGDTLAKEIQDALLEDSMDGSALAWRADDAIKFERLARQNRTEGSRGTATAWEAFGIQSKGSVHRFTFFLPRPDDAANVSPWCANLVSSMPARCIT